MRLASHCGASHFSLKLKPAIRQAQPTPPKALSVKDLVEDKAVLSASFAPYALTAASIHCKQKNTVNSKELSPFGVVSKKILRFTLCHWTCNFFCFYSPSLYRMTSLASNSSRTKRQGVGQLFFSIKTANKNAQIQTWPNYKRRNVNAGTGQWQSTHMEESDSKQY